MKKTNIERLVGFIQKQGIIRAKELKPIGIPRYCLRQLMEKGELQRISRGVYAAADSLPTTHRTLAEVSKRIPEGVICLLSALRFHDLTTQLPSQVWLAMDRKAWYPKEPGLPLRIVRFSGKALTEGTEDHTIENVSVRVYNVAKTVADCFKYRHKIGLDVAIEALRDALRQRKCTVDELWHCARICRVTNVMRPYLEATV